MYMCMCASVYMHAVHVSHLYMCMGTHMMHVCTLVCMSMLLCIHGSVCVHVICEQVSLCICVLLCGRVYKYCGVSVCAHVCVCMYTQTYRHMGKVSWQEHMVVNLKYFKIKNWKKRC